MLKVPVRLGGDGFEGIGDGCRAVVADRNDRYPRIFQLSTFMQFPEDKNPVHRNAGWFR